MSLFKLSLKWLAISFVSFLAIPVAHGQIANVDNTTSTPVEGIGHDYIHALSETVNPANGSVSLRIQVPLPKGRGISLPFSFGYDSNSAHHLQAGIPPNYGTLYWQSNNDSFAQGGWSNSIPTLRADTWTLPINVSNTVYDCFYQSNYVFRDSSGGVHALNIGSLYWISSNPSCGTAGAASTGSDSQMSASIPTGSAGVYPYPVTVYDDAGTVYYFGSAGTTGPTGTWYSFPTYIEDRNGNRVVPSSNALTLTDTLGRTLISMSGFGPSGTTNTISFPGMTYHVTWKTTSANFSVPSTWVGPTVGPNHNGCSPIAQANDSQTVVSQITLPNGQAYKFYYGTDNPDPNFRNPYGLLSEIDYPTGGWVKYTWKLSDNLTEVTIYPGFYNAAWYTCSNDPTAVCPAPIPNGCMYQYETPVVASRQVGFGGSSTAAQVQTFTYSTTWGTAQPGNAGPTTWTQKTTNVSTTDNVTGKTALTSYSYAPFTLPTPPWSNVGTSQVPNEATTKYYDWGNTTTPLRTVNKTWLDTFHLASQQTVLDTGASSRTTYTYVNSGGFLQPTEVDAYDFGASSPTRKTITNYQSFTGTSGILADAPCQVLIKDASNNVAAEIDYLYDGGTAVCGASGSAATTSVTNLPTGTHDETVFGPGSSTPRGNATTITKQCFQGSQVCTNAVSKYTFDETGQIVSTTDPCGNATCSDMNVPGETHTTTYSYADSYTVLSNGQNVSYTPSANTNAYLTRITHPTTVTSDLTGTHSIQHIENFTYDFNNGQLTVSKDENNQATAYLYNDSLARPTMVSYADGGQTAISYNDSAPSPSVITSRKIDTSGRLLTAVAVTDGLGHVVQSKLCEDGAACTQPIKTDVTFDGLSHVWKKSNPHRSSSLSTDGTTTFMYDALGRTCLVVPPDGTLPTGNTCPSTQPGNTIFTTYSGNCSTATDEAGKARQSCSDGLGRLTQVTEDPGASPHLNYVTSYGYDTLDNLRTVLQNGSRQRSFSYDSLSRLTSATNPESGAITYAYDANGNLTQRVSPAPNQTGTAPLYTSYGYDALNRNIWRVYSDSEPNVQFSYDQSSVLNGVSVSNPIGRLTAENTNTSGVYPTFSVFFSYDSMGRVLSYFQCVLNCATSGWDMFYTYDLLGNITSYTNGLGTTFTQNFDNAGRLYQITSSLSDPAHPGTLATADSSVGFWPNGDLRKVALGNGLYETAAYNNRLQPCRVTLNSTSTYALTTCADSLPAGNVQDFSYSFNFGSSDNGNLVSWSATGATGAQNFSRSYTLDSLNRLATFSATSDPTGCNGLSWTYDAWGNRTDQTVTAGTCNTFHANANTQNQLVDPVNNAYKYDAAGNMTNDGSHTYFYDAENRIKQIDGTLGTCSTATACYVYDATGRRVQKSTGATQTNYLYDLSGNVLNELDANYATLANYIYFGGALLAEYKNGTTYFVHRDHLGSTRLMTAMDKSIFDNMDYLPFGEQVTGDSGTIHKFTGKERDSESSLDNFGARYDSSSMGRFMSADPIFISPARLFDPQSLNLYAYVRNNPLNLTDPDGLDFYLACQTKDHSGCGEVQNGSEKIWVQGQTVDGKFQAYDIDMNRDGSGLYSDQFGHDYTGTFDQNGVSFKSVDEGGASGGGRFINGSDETDVNGSGIFSGLQGKFVSDCGGSCQARGSLYELQPGSGALARAEAALQLQGKSWSWLDRLSGAHAEGRQWMDKDGRIHVIENINGVNAGKTELHYEGHPNTGVTERSLHLVNAIRDLASGRAEEQKNLKLP